MSGTPEDSSLSNQERRTRSTPQWLAHVREVQQSRIHPEQRAAILERANRQRAMNHVSLQSATIAQRTDEAVYLTRRAHMSHDEGERRFARERLEQRPAESLLGAQRPSSEQQEGRRKDKWYQCT